MNLNQKSSCSLSKFSFSLNFLSDYFIVNDSFLKLLYSFIKFINFCWHCNFKLNLRWMLVWARDNQLIENERVLKLFLLLSGFELLNFLHLSCYMVNVPFNIANNFKRNRLFFLLYLFNVILLWCLFWLLLNGIVSRFNLNHTEILYCNVTHFQMYAIKYQQSN